MKIVTTSHNIGQWNTLHDNGPFPTKVLHQTNLEDKGGIDFRTDWYNASAAEVQRLIKQAADSNEGFRAYGSAWSMSHIAHHADNMQYNGKMNLKRAITAGEVHAASAYKAENLFLFQCGNTIKELSNFISGYGKALKATGASNGQTLAGCIATGVHGSALDVGSVQDYVVGLNLITGPGSNDIVYLERHTAPALNDAFAQEINARVIRNDGLFNAALVGLGSFGFIQGVVIEVEDKYLLKRYVKRLHKDEAMKLAATMNFTDTTFAVPGEVGADGKANRPFHYKVFVNPYVNDPEYVVEVMYKKPYAEGYPNPVPIIKTSIYRDLILLFTRIAEKHKNSIPKLIKVLEKSILPPVDLEAMGTIGEIFYDAGYQGPAYACAVGIDCKDAPKALELLANLAKTEGPIPGIYAMRFVKQSKATLAFTKFPITCMLEIDGLIWDPKSDDLISLPDFCTRMIDVLKQNNIPFTQHWGKNADWKYEGLVQHMYGSNARQWQEYRSALLGKEMSALFSNYFLKDTGLAEYIDGTAKELAETIA